MWVVLLAACHLDGALSPKDEGPGFDTGTPFPDEESAGPVEETCNGLDDDGDGEVDEGFADADADGIADCVDPTCPTLDIPAAGTVTPDASCAHVQEVLPVTEPWQTQVEWTWNGGGGASEWGVGSGPVVAVTDDTDGDGALTMADIPAILVVTPDHRSGTGTLVALDGATGMERWRYPGFSSYPQPAAADVDGDGVPEILCVDFAGYVSAVRPPGVLVWTSSEPVDTLYGASIINVADLEGDGTVEVVAENAVIEGATGVVRFRVPVDREVEQLGGPTVVDLEGDGVQEVIYDGAVYEPDGARRWYTGDRNFHGNWAVPVQADGDPEPELVMIGEEYGLYESDGTQLSSGPYQRGSYAGAPCAGDFDGDGETEVAFGSWSNFLLMSLDGTIEWETPIDDPSCCGGCSGFDLDGDGGLEVLYNDQVATYVFDGATGTPLLTVPRSSGTTYEYPVAVDVDGDGASELLVTSEMDNLYPGLVVLGHAGGGWPSLGTTWPIHDYAMTNIREDASVPSRPEPYWSEFGVYRARVPVTEPEADLFVRFADACVLDCDVGPAELSLQVGNQGLVDVPEGATLTLYALSGGEAQEIDAWALPAIPSGATLPGIYRLVLPEEIGVDGFRAVVTPAGVGECNETNNTAEWTDVPC